MFKVGLTGGIGSGKTTVSDLFASLGVPVIDTDIIAHKLTDDKQVLYEIVNLFGKKVLDQNDQLDRKILSQFVFDNPEKKQKLESILHPKIRDAVNKNIYELMTNDSVPAYAIIVIPLLIETNFNQIIDHVLVVMADKTNRIERIKQRDNRNMDEIHAIISTQTNDQRRIDAADDIIENNSNIKALDIKVQQLHKKYLTIAAVVK